MDISAVSFSSTYMVLDDGLVELEEQFFVDLFPAPGVSNAQVDANADRLTITILDNDGM